MASQWGGAARSDPRLVVRDARGSSRIYYRGLALSKAGRAGARLVAPEGATAGQKARPTKKRPDPLAQLGFHIDNLGFQTGLGQ